MSYSVNGSEVDICKFHSKNLRTSFPISHFATLLLFNFFIYVMYRIVIFQAYLNSLDAERCF